MVNIDSPLVSVWMVTYNHEQYIRQCLESVMSQKVDFAFEVIIGEDASTDGTRAIVEEFQERYPAIIKPVYHEKNVGASKNAYNFCYPRLAGKYVACMEGDDYWTDPHKLQKQVDFLENNSEYLICWTKYKFLKEVELIIPDWVSILDNEKVFNIDLNNIFNPYSTHTLTTMFRRSALNLSSLLKMKYAKDNTIFCLCLSQGKGAILNFFGGVYRNHSGGVYSNVSLLNQRYSSFLNIDEIIRVVPGCNTSNLKLARKNLLLASYYLATSEKITRSTLIKVLKFYTKVLLYAPGKEIFRATKKLFSQLLIQ